MFCENCGKPIDGDAFCGNCGSKANVFAKISVVSCTSTTITIDLGESFKNVVVSANGERLQNGFCIFAKTIKQIKPVEKELSVLEQQEIIKAVSEWNAHLKTIVFD